MNQKPKYNLEDRLVTFACLCLDVCELLPNTKAGQNLEYQLSKSSTACALIYGEAQAAKSPNDFLHKMKLVLKGSKGNQDKSQDNSAKASYSKFEN
jgi:four helix bundle protein